MHFYRLKTELCFIWLHFHIGNLQFVSCVVMLFVSLTLYFTFFPSLVHVQCRLISSYCHIKFINNVEAAIPVTMSGGYRIISAFF